MADAMSDASAFPGAVRRQMLVDRLADIQTEIDEIREALPSINDDELRPRVTELVAAASALVALFGQEPGAEVAELLVQLQSATRTLRVPAADPDLGVTQTLRTLRAAQGRLRSAVDDALDAVHALDLPLRPVAPQPEPNAKLPLPAMLKRLEATEQRLDELDAARAEPSNVIQQSGLLNVYVDTMRLELLLAKLNLRIGSDTFDLGALLRVAESMADLTADLLATVRAWRDRLSPAVTRAAEGMRGAVRSVASGARKLGVIVMQRSRRSERIAAEAGDALGGVGTPEMVFIPPGSFVMGTSEEEDEREGMAERLRKWSKPQHTVTLRRGFYMAKYPVTRGEFAAFIADTGYEAAGSRWREPGFPQTDRDPVVYVSADDVDEYVRWLSRKSGGQYRLPSEAEWEYAARAGTTTARFWGDGWDLAASFLNTDRGGTYPVGSFKPNAFGLCDMLGNVWEWVADQWHDNYQGAPNDGSAWMTDRNEGRRVLRGGSWVNIPRNVRAGVRVSIDADSRNDYVGFRLARTL
jgi:formylglycine-generating enzyme required for sulfatase activity